jgi:hypothetical protein|tara:strand:- start:1899 stop:2042 length:144 start_codon:yes stop_codon:yes gene_type:complete
MNLLVLHCDPLIAFNTLYTAKTLRYLEIRCGSQKSTSFANFHPNMAR